MNADTKILTILRLGSCRTIDLVRVAGEPPLKVLRLLAEMKAAGWVTSEPEGNFYVWRIA